MKWQDMIEGQFDRSKVTDRKTREFIETAGETMFPELLPEVAPVAAKPATEPMPGQAALFGDAFGQDIPS